MEMKEKSARSEEIKIKKQNKKEATVRCHLFFDGTLNNRTNIEQRLLAAPEEELTEEEKEDAEELKSKYKDDEQRKAKVRYELFGAKSPDEENSYEGYFTNIEIMDRYADDAKNYDYTFKTYIEGAGSINYIADEQSGYAFAKGDSGVKKKVKSGLNKIIEMLRLSVLPNEIIEKITIDVFGFSRGAATARYCIHQALFSDMAFKKKLEASGYEINKVEVCFAGLFDTVSTFGHKVIIGLANNVKDLKLDSISHAKQVIHLTAADEHRRYFSLTNIKSAQGDSKEIYLPGVHSDIGGGYRDNTSENLKIYKTTIASRAEKEKQRLVESGWYNDNELDLLKKWVRVDGKRNKLRVALKTNRGNISNKYSRIPLHIMTKYARNKKININKELDKDESIPSKLNNVKQKIEQYIASTNKSEPGHWHVNDDWLRELRHDYFHFSARYKIGHGPRFSKGRRFRKVYNG